MRKHRSRTDAKIPLLPFGVLSPPLWLSAGEGKQRSVRKSQRGDLSTLIGQIDALQRNQPLLINIQPGCQDLNHFDWAVLSSTDQQSPLFGGFTLAAATVYYYQQRKISRGRSMVSNCITVKSLFNKKGPRPTVGCRANVRTLASLCSGRCSELQACRIVAPDWLTWRLRPP